MHDIVSCNLALFFTNAAISIDVEYRETLCFFVFSHKPGTNSLADFDNSICKGTTFSKMHLVSK